MAIEIVSAKIADKSILRHLLELCLHDYSEFNGEEVDEHGLFGYSYLDNYWTEEGRTAFLILAEGKLAGFAMVRQHDFTVEGLPISWMAEFFILRSYRGKGIGAQAAVKIFDRFPGRWRVGQEPGNLPAQNFWHKIIERYTGGKYQEVKWEGWNGPLQEFSSPGDNMAGWAVIGPELSKGSDCEAILRLLPDWFGIESAIVQYGKDIDTLPTWTAQSDSGQALGFITIKQHNPFSAEVFVMGVRPETHHKGIGKALMSTAEAYLRAEKVEYMQVKTIGPSCNDPFYARTRAFYMSAGYQPLEELKQVWNADNPCLIFVKRL